MATVISARKRYTKHEKSKHLKATKNMSYTDQGKYCDAQGISINTLRSWRRAKDGTTSTTGKKKAAAKKPAAKKPAAKKKAKAKKASAKKKAAAKKPARRKATATKKTPAKRSPSVKARVKAKLTEDFEASLEGKGKLSKEMTSLLTDVHAAL